ncbi:diguanylate cyclase [Telmatospirillum sp.]|uniref:GGDEF domain-containing protein n=1 Tax=Telmatospirillum sp. TaxID=2079197 RepID=UPI00284C958B|nr:diguanylate cyclase [Telmatospirillum sp.]MDR3439744.1 diguanylate cyclase [Telmatospirillum sp.]
MTRKTKIFYILSVVLLVSDLGLVGINFISARRTLRDTVSDRAASLHEGFDIALYTTELKLIEIASFVAEIEEVRHDVEEGGRAAAEEGGGGGGPKTDHWRQALMDVVGPRWAQLQFRYLLRQFSFYLPDDTAFLRVHVPYDFGDRIDRPDFLVASASARHEPMSGFDIDRTSVGVRAAVPMTGDATHGDAAGDFGVVEVGSSLDAMLVPICPNSPCGTSVLLYQDPVRAIMAPEAVESYFTPDRRIGNFFIEAASNPAMTRALVASEQPPDPNMTEPPLMKILGRWVTVTYFPFRDQASRTDASRPPVGVVAIWQDMDQLVHDFQRRQLISLGFAIAAFVVMEFFLHRLIRLVTARLEDEISRTTSAVQTLLRDVSDLANRDHLTELYNRRAFFERLEEEMARSSRSQSPFGLLALDVDHFKQINDTHGHPVGDEVLRQLALAIRDTIRTADVAGRVGGEEFTILLPESTVVQVSALAQRLRERVGEIAVPTGQGNVCKITFSAGILQWHRNLNLEAHLRLVDKALYRAKSEGRDRVIIADPADIYQMVLSEAVVEKV